MPAMNVKIIRASDPPPFPDLADRTIHHVTAPVDIIGLDGGMSSGKASVALKTELDDGSAVIIETSLDLWIAATCALRGAFPEQFNGTPLD